MSIENIEPATSRGADIYEQFKWASIAVIDFFYNPTDRKRKIAQKQIDLLARFANVPLQIKAKRDGGAYTDDISKLIKRVSAFLGAEPRYGDELNALRFEGRSILDEYDRLITEIGLLDGENA